MPRENPPTLCSCLSSNPTLVNASVIIRDKSSEAMPDSEPKIFKIAVGVRCEGKTGDSKTAPMCFKVERSETGFENLVIEPESGLIKPKASFKSVDFPARLEPTNPMIVPLGTFKQILSKAWIFDLRFVLKTLQIFSSFKIHSVIVCL